MSRFGRRALARALLLALVVASSSCICPSLHHGPPLNDAAYPGELKPSTALPDGLFYQQRVSASYHGHDFSFTAAIETSQGKLQMLALTPFGTRAFLIEQIGTSVRFTRYVDRELPFPPRFILLDLQRTLFLGIDAAPLQDGERSAVVNGEEIRERFAHGKLMQRSYRRLDGKPAGLITVSYGSGLQGVPGSAVGSSLGPGAQPLPKIELQNGWFGYTLSITTLSEN